MIRRRYLNSDFVLDFITIIPLDLLVYYYTQSESTTIAFLRIPKMLTVRKLYGSLRQSYNERSSSAARLLADIRALYCFSLGIVHILACVWYDLTKFQDSYITLEETNFVGYETGYSVGAV